MLNPKKFVELGRVAGAHGLQGQVRVRYFGDGPGNLLGCDQVWLGEGREDASARRYEVDAGGLGRAGEARLSLRGVSDRDVAQGLRGLLVLAHEADLEALPEGDFYWHQLIGCRVETATGQHVGEVKEILETGAHDLLLVEDEKKKRQLISTARELLPEIDLARNRVVVADLPGLILDESEEEGAAKAAKDEDVEGPE